MYMLCLTLHGEHFGLLSPSPFWIVDYTRVVSNSKYGKLLGETRVFLFGFQRVTQQNKKILFQYNFINYK